MNPERAETEKEISDTTSTVLNELRMEQKLCDVVIKTEDVEFKAHKIILSSCSLYFRTLFCGAWATDKLVYSIPGVSPEIMSHIISYAYTSSVPLTDQNVKQVLEAADQFLIPGLVQDCCVYLENKLCLRNCMTTWRVLDFFNCTESRKKVFHYVLKHFEEIVEVSEEFLELSENLLGLIIQDDHLSVRNERVVFEAVLRWINHLPEERRGCMAVLLAKVRLGLMNESYLVYDVFANALIQQNPECTPIVHDASAAFTDFLSNRHSDTIYSNPLSRPRMPPSILLVTGGKNVLDPAVELEAYDSRADRWVTFGSIGAHRAHHGAAVLNNCVYLIGGCNSEGYLNTVQKIHLPSFTSMDVASLNSRRSSVSVAVLGGLIYAMGGHNRHPQRSVECYHPELDRWIMAAPMHSKRTGAGATTFNGKIYVCGGTNGNYSASTAECYNPETNTWTMIAPMRVARAGLGVAAYQGRIYAIGGVVNHTNTCEAYDPQTNRWSRVPSMFNRRSYFGIEVVDDQLFAVAGYNGTNTLLTVERYDENAGMWFSAAPLEAPRSGLSCCVLPGLHELTTQLFPRPPLKSSTVEEAAGGHN
ncbi:kelch-like protein 10 [Halichoeres trimaculatus]|uniref:kelch-like protein 10 n=1 Tax=Halichoeres trimaculatus TaxID=147232 RepID=UPI003D9F1411